MKKTIVASAISGLLATGMLLYSCQKEQMQSSNPATALTQTASNEYNVSASNDLLSFKTVDDYRAIADNSSAQAKEKFMDYASRMNGFTPMSKLSAVETRGGDYEDIGNDFLKGILNKDAAVQIGDYIYKISVKKEKVFVINKSDIKDYKDAVSGNAKNKKVQVFSIGDEVLTLTGNIATLRGNGSSNENMDYPPDDGPSDGGGGGGGGSGGTTCNETGVSNQNVSDDNIFRNLPFSPSTVEISGRIKYERYGLYFSLYSHIEGSAEDKAIAYILDWKVYYHVKYGNTVGYPFPSYNGIASANSLNHREFSYHSYQGSHTLNEIRMQCRWGFRAYFSSTNYLEYFTNWKEVRVNC